MTDNNSIQAVPQPGPFAKAIVVPSLITQDERTLIRSRLSEELINTFEGVAAWSKQNFGDQKGINHIAPMLGIGEEFGELMEAVLVSEDVSEINDAVGDIGIYTIDMLSRAGIPPEMVWPFEGIKHTPIKIPPAVSLGRMFHCVLKFHQGIRGYENVDFFHRNLMLATVPFLEVLEATYGLSTHTVGTWNRVVSKRNWVANPGGQSAS
jgi:NTP pyrophosphatase (non-canonical NTP hydrolase)